MRIMLAGLLSLWCLCASAERYHHDSLPNYQTEKYFSFNPLALAEPQMAVGAGYGFRWTKRSELFTELSLLSDNPFYKNFDNNLFGFRAITQYRYHFLRPWVQYGWFGRGIQSDGSFLSFEARVKNYWFSGTESFINQQTNDTLSLHPYRANATVLGGAILLGDVYDLSRNGKLRLEMSAGIGVKQKMVRMKNLPAGFQLWDKGVREWSFVPRIYDPYGFFYLPFAVRLQYKISK